MGLGGHLRSDAIVALQPQHLVQPCQTGLFTKIETGQPMLLQPVADRRDLASQHHLRRRQSGQHHEPFGQQHAHTIG